MSRGNASKVRADGPEIQRLRMRNGWSRVALAEDAQVDRKTVARAEQSAWVQLSTIALIASALGAEPKDIIQGVEPPGSGGGRAGAATETPAGLVEWVCSFDTYMADRAHDFVGREFVFEAIDRFVQGSSTPSGYFLVRGVPGIGKSALLAHLVRQRKLPVHHFNIELQAINTARQFLGNVCARIISHFRLPYTGLPPDFDKDGAFFNKILKEAADLLDHDQRLVIAIDALDEVAATDIRATENILFLPPGLPAGVYIVVTSRHVEDLHLHVSNLHVLDLEADSEGNLRDVRAFIERHATRDGIQRWCLARAIPPDQFVEHLLVRSHGNFMYLHYVLPAIEQGAFADGGAEELPDGLRAYYRRHWQKMRESVPGDFNELHRFVLCVFAAAGEAWPIEEVVRITRIPLRDVRRVIRSWREFFQVMRPQGSPVLYRLYHSTFAEYLSDEVDPGLQTFHRLIADALLDQAARPDSDSGTSS